MILCKLGVGSKTCLKVTNTDRGETSCHHPEKFFSVPKELQLSPTKETVWPVVVFSIQLAPWVWLLTVVCCLFSVCFYLEMVSPVIQASLGPVISCFRVQRCHTQLSCLSYKQHYRISALWIPECTHKKLQRETTLYICLLSRNLPKFSHGLSLWNGNKIEVFLGDLKMNTF